MSPKPAPVADVADVAPLEGHTARDLAGLLDDVDELLARYVAWPSLHARYAAAAWIAHTHLVATGICDTTPRLAVLSPEKGCGKTRVLLILEQLVRSPIRTASITPSALMRLIPDRQPTFLIDEVDAMFRGLPTENTEAMRAIINDGHRAGARSFRTNRTTMSVMEMPVFAAVALAGIGDLPETILDRSIVISMRRRATGERVHEWRDRKVTQITEPVRERLDAWAIDACSELAGYEPEMPLEDRPADVWEPLVIIGDHAGPVWAERIRTAAIELNRERSGREPSLGVLLLADCRQVIGDRHQVSTDELLVGLHELAEAPWATLKHGPLDARGLARRLAPYAIRSASHRFDDRVLRGYLRADFVDAWDRYLEEGL